MINRLIEAAWNAEPKPVMRAPREHYRTMVLAIVKELREPTEAMISKAWDDFDWGPPMAGARGDPDATPHNVWPAMVDAMLDEPAVNQTSERE